MTTTYENMDLNTFLALEREKLREDKDKIEKFKQAQSSSTPTPREDVNDQSRVQSTSASALDNSLSDICFADAQVECTPDDNLNEVKNENEHPNEVLSKSAKDWVNHKELFTTNLKELKGKENQNNATQKNKDDMEQWVTDTFYSYFPGFNNEYQKRQSFLRDRQRENQENFLKHQMMNASKNAPKQKNFDDVAVTNRSAIAKSRVTDKTDLEIIVNNPNYVPPKSAISARPDSTRLRLLQDLKHTELSTTSGSEELLERNRRHAELESARKKDYQRELMQQIEEKRRSVELMREKERQEDEALTKRLQEQLKTIHLEEQYEKEKMRSDRLRFDAEQNRLIRDHLIAKLENDTKLLYANAKNGKTDARTENNAANKVMNTSNTKSTASSDNNKVYKYFTNSAKHEFRRGKPLPAEIELDVDIPDSINSERECFHLSDKVCPMCDAPLKSYENCCLRCQSKLSLKINQGAREENGADTNGNKTGNSIVDGSEELVRCDLHSYSLVCVKCERLYAMCPTCLANSEVCRACHRKLNVCLSCRRKLCTFCLEEVALGKDTERTHCNDRDSRTLLPNIKADTGSERSFQVLEVNYKSPQADCDIDGESSPLSSHQASNVSYKNIHNNLNTGSRPPFSVNIDRDSVFHPDYQTEPAITASAPLDQLPKIVDKNLSFDLDSSQTEYEQQMRFDRIRKETDRRLSRYLRNYGDLALQKRSQSEANNRSTQTSPATAGRRDVVLHEEHNLSMPLLREMPKMTRSVSGNLLEKPKSKQTKIDHLKRRWEIPAVQKFTISHRSPRVLTQVGAIRKQLQAEHLFADKHNDE